GAARVRRRRCLRPRPPPRRPRPRRAPPVAYLGAPALSPARVPQPPLLGAPRRRRSAERGTGARHHAAPSPRGGAAVKGKLVRREELSPAERDAMLRLFDAHFAGVTPARFAADLAEKEWVL